MVPPALPEGHHQLRHRVGHVGDGDAFRVEVIPINCRIQFRREWSRPSEDPESAARGWEFARTVRDDPRLVPRIAASKSLLLTIS